MTSGSVPANIEFQDHVGTNSNGVLGIWSHSSYVESNGDDNHLDEVVIENKWNSFGKLGIGSTAGSIWNMPTMMQFGPILPSRFAPGVGDYIIKHYEQLTKVNTAAGDISYLATLTKYARVAESVSWTSFGLATAFDVSAAASGQISWGKAGVNFGVGLVGGVSAWFAPVSIFYFSVDAFYDGGWDHVRGVNGWEPPPPTPAGYENVGSSLIF